MIFHLSTLLHRAQSHIEVGDVINILLAEDVDDHYNINLKEVGF